jgi:hypothetical protein
MTSQFARIRSPLHNHRTQHLAHLLIVRRSQGRTEGNRCLNTLNQTNLGRDDA